MLNLCEREFYKLKNSINSNQDKYKEYDNSIYKR